ncbi:penicillin-binding protein activator [Aestuariibius sp. HNIBRBA575]|uniref:penicillin-binding protein activator n=1 Tax=Aestuariibius sp. HNIBRBA575 TaxID=3233343 RepID=UPI0034A3EA40
MFACLPRVRKTAIRIFSLLSVVWLAACDAVVVAPGGNAGNQIDPDAPVMVALLVPGASSNPVDNLMAVNLENAARMAIADLQDVDIDLRVYNTSGDATIASNQAISAVNDGAAIILGPLYADSANAVGVAVAGTGTNVIAFSNNPSIAGGNVFILGNTFANTANRLVSYGRTQGLDNWLVVHGNDTQGAFGKAAIEQAVRNNGGTLSGIQAYDMTQQSILESAPAIASAARQSGADAVFLTGGIGADLSIVATALPEAGLSPATTRYVGLTLWDALPQAAALPGLQGGYFAKPDVALAQAFENRYAGTYGDPPHPLASLAYDGIAAIGALASTGRRNALTTSSITQGAGFQGTSGIFRFLPDGTNQRGLAVAQIQNNQVVIVDPAPRSFGGTGF